MSHMKSPPHKPMDNRMTDTIAEAAEQAGAAIRTATTDFGRTARSRADDTLDDLAQQVARQPLSALLIAAGAGMLAGLFLARR